MNVRFFLGVFFFGKRRNAKKRKEMVGWGGIMFVSIEKKKKESKNYY